METSIFRYNSLSLVYLLYLLLLPWFQWPNKHTLRGHTGRYIKALFSTSLIFLLAHVSFQICLYTIPSLDDALGHNCSSWETLSRHVGVSRLPLEDPWSMVWLLTPDLGIFIISLITLILCSRLLKKREEGPIPHMSSLLQEAWPDMIAMTLRSQDEVEDEQSPYSSSGAAQLAARLRATAQRFLRNMGRILAVTLLALAGITLPSAFSAFYFILFIGVCTWWACHFPISHLGFNALCVMVAFFTGGHLVCLYLYQSSFAQDMFSPVGLWARLFGLKDIIKPGNCSSFDVILNTQHDWPVYVNPGILLLLYISTDEGGTVKATQGEAGEEVELRPWEARRHSNEDDDTKQTLLTTGESALSESQISKEPVTNGSSQHDIGPSGEAAADNPLRLVGRMILQQSYICALIAMMVWSITYHSWLTFVLLLWSCVIWMLRARQRCATLCSPFILLYGLALCCLQYVWAMDLETELPQHIGTMSLHQLGLDRAQYPCLRLGAMLLFTLTFWLLLRQSVKDMFSRKKRMTAPLQEVTTGESTGRNESILKVLGGMVMSLYAKYWIYVCGGMFIMVSFAGKIVAYKIVYMLLFLLCLCLYQVYYSLWRRLLKVFWWTVVAYTMVVLIAIYTFQFEDFPQYWANFTGFDKEQKRGIDNPDLVRSTEEVRFEEEELITEQGGDPSEVDEAIPSKWGLVMDRLMVLSRKFSDTLTHVQSFIWRVLELHIVKIVAFFLVWVALLEPSAMNLVLVVLWSVAMPYGRFRAMASCLSTIWVCVIIICKMLYQLRVVHPPDYSNNCTQPLGNETSLEKEEWMNSTLYKAPVDPANWFGVRKDDTVLGYTKDHLLVLMLLVFEATVYRHQIHHYRQLQRSPPPIPVIFPQATRDTLDKGLLHCIKYLLNYSFYKFGLEICFLMTVNVIGQRMNFVVIVHGCWLVAIMVQRRRAAIAKIWSKYCLFLVVFMIYQYVLCVGIPPALCIADFLLLMCASQQWTVFENEKKEDWMVMGGENKDNPDPMEDMPFNPAPNFINCRSYLDMAKVLVFRYMFWFVLSVVFVTGATRISVFGLGYLMACFFFLLFGTRLLIKPSRTRLVMWDCLIMYNVAVIISKNILSILACVFVLEMQKNFCWVIQLFSLVCTVKGYYDSSTVCDKDCSLPVEEAGIIWDSICFFFLLLQRRVFLSFYFLHVSADLQATARQASRGFELFRASIIKNMHFYQQAEKKSILQLKESMKRIRDKQQKYKEGRKNTDTEEQPSVLHSGEYYMFESDSGEEEESIEEEKKPRKQTAFQLAYQAWVTSAKDALKDRQQRQREQREEAKKQQTSQATDDADEGEAVFDGNSKEVEEIQEEGEDVASQATGSDIVQRILDILKFLWVLFLAMVDGFTMWLNLLTKQYVDTSVVLSEERYLFIHNISQRPSREPTDDQISQDSENLTVETCLDETDTDNVRFNSNVKPFIVEELIQSREFYSSQNRLLKLLFALYNVLAAHSELVCYFIIVLNNLVTASVISLVLPILVFLWAMLSVPRPSKRFWMTAIIYTEVMVVVKYLFQFGFFPWNSEYELKLNEDKPFFPPRILGLEKTDNYIRYDLLQLLVLFFHRSLLQRYGLWDQKGPLEEKSNLSSDEKNKNERDEKVFQLSDEEDSRAQPEPDTEVLPVTPSTETPNDAEIQTDPEPNIQTDTTETLDTVKEDGKKKSLFLRFRKKKQSEKDTKQKEPKKKKKKSKKHSEDTSKKLLNAIGGKFKGLFLSIVKNVYKPTCGFFQNILHAEYRAATDVYALMFLTDVVDFIIIVFGFWAFGKHSAAADIASSLSEDQVPEAFLVMLLIQFSTMIIDRALYLRKSILGKLIFQVILVFGIHLWMFFILPAVTERMFNHNSVAQLWYFFKCIYFTLSAYQIRCGYPTRILGNFLTKKFNHLNLFLFQGFRLVPFLVELRAVMDWVWTDTTLSLSNWMCVEDIYANIFIIKCSRETEKKYPQPKGQKKKKIVKYGMGGIIILFLICIIWFPLLFISLVKSVVGVVNHPVDVSVTVRLGGYEPLFTMSVQQQSIQPFTEQDYNQLANLFGKNAVAMQFITMYSYEDIVTANIEGSSGSGPHAYYVFVSERDLGKGGTVEHTFDKHAISLSPQNPVRANLASLLLGTQKDPVRVPYMFPNYIRAPTGAEAKPVMQLYDGGEEGYQDVTLSLKREASVNTTGAQEWWDISIADCRESCGVLPMVIFNDKVSPPSLGFLAGYGIMGLYVSVVLVIGKFVRGFFSEISHSIMFEELPCVDRILKLCIDIFLVRETGELELEEELYSKLIFLYRSPETMIKWTREKNED
ncbi:piezo-type mechanosensitive ion channel component 1-like protein [Labeo rohita]|uniref:Piezo-type mechanosensitive ion channel component 1-like protein n=1 Tax=Labeo rohita TaxID=84645 RepID=A0A498M9G8_LABRO|nr:piezo-type mechanosensitive ion channel component 1-like protein [Labeo rohita]